MYKEIFKHFLLKLIETILPQSHEDLDSNSFVTWCLGGKAFINNQKNLF
tara:strand:- start:98 stop:244 length:147 start_codon:yes stop_codon:yes gene_type:complete